MADDESRNGQASAGSPTAPPAPAGPMSGDSGAAATPAPATVPEDDNDNDDDVHVPQEAHVADPDQSLLQLRSPAAAASRDSRSAQSAHGEAQESSHLETTAMDETREPDETLSEEAVRRHLNDVESSFLPALSPILGESASSRRGADDNLFDSPMKPALPSQQQHRPQQRQHGDADATAASIDLSNVQNINSSPTLAAAARSRSRAVSVVSNPKSANEGTKDDLGNAIATSADDSAASLSREQYHRSDRLDAGSTPGNSLRISKRPKYLRSRHDSERSSTSSFVTNPEPNEDNDATAGAGLDYALHSGGAVSALGISRMPSNFLLRSTSIGSMASGFAPDDADPPTQSLEPLAEIDSRPGTRNGDLLQTPRPSRDIITAPTDTVIAQHVKNVQVPESLAKAYKFKNGLQTPRRPAHPPISTGTVGRSGRNLTLKEQSNTIERLSKENFDLKLKVMFLSDRLDKLSEEGIKEMISENVDLKTSLAVLQRDNRVLRKRVKELERQAREEETRPSTARSAGSSADHTSRTDDGEAQEREEELIFLRERVEEYAEEIERLRNEGLHRESERRKLADIVKTLGERTGDNIGRQEEADVWKDLLEQETARREQADEDNKRLRDELFRLKREASGGQGPASHTTHIYNITKRQREQTASPSRTTSGLSGDVEGSHANFSAATTLVEELRRESEQLRHENAELRREVGAQTSMLTSRNREKERLYQEIEDLKIAQRRQGHPALSAVDSILDRSASRAGNDRSPSRASEKTKQTFADEDAAREELENKLAELRDRMSEVKLQNQELQRELEGCMEDFETAIEGKRQAEETAMSLQEDLDTAMNDLVALQAERDEALREQGDMEAEFEALRQEAQEEIDSLEAEADQRNEEVQRLQADLTDRSENFDALQEEMRKLSESLVRLEDEQDTKLRRIQQLEEELESLTKELEELEQKLMEANEKNQRLSVQQESSQGEISFLREEQEADKIRIGELEAAVLNAEHSLREEKDRAKELDTRLQQERVQREMVADREKEEVQQFVNELNREASSAKDEVRRLRKSLSSREVEATEWKERLIELENNLREALGDLNGTRSSLLKSIAKMQRELENTIRELDSTRASVVEKDRIIKQRDALLESHALESRKVAELLDKERVAHRNTKSQFDTFQKTHHHLSQTASTQDVRIAELENTRGQDRKKIALLEQSARDQLTERNELLLTLWQRLSSLCGREWIHNNALVDRQVVPSVEVIANRLPGFSKNLLAAVKTVETMFGSLQTKIKSVERDLHREYQALESNLEMRVKKLDRLETMVRNSISSGSGSSNEMQSRMQRLENAYRQLKVENATLKTAQDVRSRVAKSNVDGALTYGGVTGSPSPSVPRGPGDHARSRSSRADRGGRSDGTNTGTGIPLPPGGFGGLDVALAGETAPSNNDNRWLLRLRDMEYKLKLEREGRNQDRHAARQRLGGLEMENRDLRERVRRANSEAG